MIIFDTWINNSKGWEIEQDVTHKIRVGWMQWRRALGVLGDLKIPI